MQLLKSTLIQLILTTLLLFIVKTSIAQKDASAVNDIFNYRKEIVKLKNDIASKSLQLVALGRENSNLRVSNQKLNASIEQQNKNIYNLKAKLRLAKTKSEKEAIALKISKARNDKLIIISDINQKLFNQIKSDYKEVLLENDSIRKSLNKEISILKDRLFYSTFSITGVQKRGPNKGLAIPLDSLNIFSVKASRLTHISIRFETGKDDEDLPMYFYTISYNGIDIDKHTETPLPIQNGSANYEIKISDEFSFRKGIYTVTVRFVEGGITKLKIHEFKLK